MKLKDKIVKISTERENKAKLSQREYEERRAKEIPVEYAAGREEGTKIFREKIEPKILKCVKDGYPDSVTYYVYDKTPGHLPLNPHDAGIRDRLIEIGEEEGLLVSTNEGEGGSCETAWTCSHYCYVVFEWKEPVVE